MTIRKRMEGKVELGEGDNKKEVEFFVVQPNNKILKDADRYKAKVWNDATADGVLTKKELHKTLEERGIWSKEKSDEEKALAEHIGALEKKLYHGDGKKKPKVSEGRNIAIEIRRKRMEMRDLVAEKLGLEENTADNLADNARFDWIVAHCTFYKNGQPVYKNFDDYNSRSADELAFEAASKLSQMLYNLDASFEKNLPENKFLSKFQLVNEELSLIDPNNPDWLIDTDGRRIDKDGYFLDDDGNRIDKDGNPLTAEGEYVMVDYENDLVTTPKKAPKPEPEPETEKAES